VPPKSQLLGSTAMREALDELVPLFEKQSGHKVAMNLYPAATLVAQGQGGRAGRHRDGRRRTIWPSDEDEASGRRHARRFCAFAGRRRG